MDAMQTSITARDFFAAKLTYETDPADLAADRAAGRRIGCPVLFAWSERDDMVDLYGDPAAIWRDWADDVRTASIPSGHHMAEEAPRELTDVLAGFLAEDPASVNDRRG